MEHVHSLSPSERVALLSDPRYFLHFFAYYYEEFLAFPFARFHGDFAQDIIDMLQNKITRCVWCTAGETAKSSIAKAFLVYCIAYKYTLYPNVDAHDRDNSVRFIYEAIHTFQTNARFRNDFGDLFTATSSRSEEKTEKKIDNFITTTGVRVEAHTTQESMRGRVHGPHRPSMVILDDFENLSTVRSPAATLEVSQHISEMKRGLSQEKSFQLYLCNYLSETGNVAALEADAKLDPMMRFRKIPRVYDDGTPSWPERDVMTDAELLLPQNKGKISIETKMRAMRRADTGDADWMREMQLRPVDPLGEGPDKGGYSALLPLSLLEPAIVPVAPYPSPPSSIIMGVDPAGDGADATAIVIRTPFFAFVHAELHKKDENEVADVVIAAATKYGINPRNIVVDAFGIGYKLVKVLSLKGFDIRAVNVGEQVFSSKERDKCLNDRAYGYKRLRDWLASGGRLQAHPQWKVEAKAVRYLIDENNLMRIIPKKEMLRRGHKSPNCFAEGTMILTPNGEKPIEELSVGDMVCTPFGNSRIFHIHDNISPVVALRHGDKTTFVTPEHKVATNRGWVSVDSLTSNDKVIASNPLNAILWRIKMWLSTTAGLSGGFAIIHDTLSRTSTMGLVEKAERKNCSIDTSGRSITARKYPLGSMFTTLTATMMIIPLKILGLSALRNMLKCTPQGIAESADHFLKKHGKPPQDGTVPQKELSGTENTGRIVGKIEKRLNVSVSNVGKNLILGIRTHYFVLELAFKKVENLFTRLLKKSAFFVLRYLWPIAIGQPVAVHIPAQEKFVRVLNLTLESHNAYYADGLLVKNCSDALMLTHLFDPQGDKRQRSPSPRSAPFDPYSPCP